jgi:hypothetical protein
MERNLMARVRVHWEDPHFEIGRGIKADRRTRLFGELTTDTLYTDDGGPVLVEEITNRVYLPTDLPRRTTLVLESKGTEFPDVARRAQQAGYHVERPS